MTQTGFPSLIVLCLLLICSLPVFADTRADEISQALSWRSADMPVPLLAIGPCKTPPVIDGKYSAEKWADACAISTLTNHQGPFAYPNALVYLTYDAHRVYFGYLRDKETPSWFTARSRFRDSATYLDPHIELFLSPDPGSGKELVYQFCINAYGAVYDVLNVPAFGQTNPGYNPKIEFKTSETQSQWYLEGSIDVKDLDPQGRFRDGATWRGNFCWAWPQLSWASHGTFWIVRDNMGFLRLDAAAPALQWLDAYSLQEGKLAVKAAVKNMTEQPQTYRLAMTVTGESAGDILAKTEEKVSLQPGERRELLLQGPGDFSGKRGHATLTCTSEDGKTPYYQQFLRFDGHGAGTREKRDEAMQQTVAMPKEMALSTRFGQLANALEVQADVWYLRRSGIAPERVRVWVESAAHPGTRLAQQEISRFQQDLALCKIELPGDQPFGKYLAKAQALAKDGTVLAEAQSEFTRLNLHDAAVNKAYRGRDGHLLDWIGTKCGVSEQVPPPWTPVQGNLAGGLTVLNRHYTLDASGLPRQIVSVGVPLLAAPVRFVAVIDGKALPLKPIGKVGHFALDKAGLSAAWEGKAGNKALELTSTARLEYDGFITYRLKISCPKPVTLDALYLDIPIRKELAERMSTPSSQQLLPGEQGVLWQSKEAVDNELMNTLVSHVWIGNWKCGMAFVADDTKGWYEQMHQSLETIVRGDDAVHLHVNFVQGPRQIHSTSLNFALMPTPTRERPKGWRNYPVMENRSYFWVMDWFADRQYDKVNGQAAWNWDDVSAEQLAKLKAQDMQKEPMLGLPYTNPWFAYPFVVPWEMENTSPVFPIMNEDWANMPSRWGAVRPVATLRDYMTFNYDFYFRTKHYGGFYIDEAYGAEKEDINMINGSGWIDRDGQLRGSYHSVDVRELFKRQYNISLKYSPIGKPFMLNHVSWGLSPQYMSHVTCGIYVENLPIGPGECYLDHMPLSTLQFWNGGAWGHFSDVTGLGPDERSQRYCMGQLMLHDVTFGFATKSKIKQDFGIGADDVQFFGYWEEPTVATSSDANIKASVFQRPNSLLVVVCNVDTHAEHQALLTLDLKTLGLPENCRVLDYENGQSVSRQDGKIAIKLAPRDVQYLHLLP